MKIFIEIDRGDLRRGCEDIPIKNIKPLHSILTLSEIEMASEIVFVENSGYRKILKKR